MGAAGRTPSRCNCSLSIQRALLCCYAHRSSEVLIPCTNRLTSLFLEGLFDGQVLHAVSGWVHTKSSLFVISHSSQLSVLVIAGAGVVVAAILFITLLLHPSLFSLVKNGQSSDGKESRTSAENEAYFRQMVDAINNSPHARWKARYTPYGRTHAQTMRWEADPTMQIPSVPWTSEKQALYLRYLDEVAARFDSDLMKDHLRLAHHAHIPCKSSLQISEQSLLSQVRTSRWNSTPVLPGLSAGHSSTCQTRGDAVRVGLLQCPLSPRIELA